MPVNTSRIKPYTNGKSNNCTTRMPTAIIIEKMIDNKTSLYNFVKAQKFHEKNIIEAVTENSAIVDANAAPF